MRISADANVLDFRGQWSRLVDGVQLDFVSVPGSFAPMGQCTLAYTFDCDWALGTEERVFLVTEGVLASAEFALNGHPLGAAAAWATYRFELPAGLLRATGNLLQATIRDLHEVFGPVPGRRNDAGLIRPLYLERRPATFLADVYFRAELADDLRSAACCISITLDGPAGPPVHVTLAEGDTGRVVAHGVATAAAPYACTVEYPRLWSPESPYLYTLTAVVEGAPAEQFTEQVGIRRLAVRGQDLYLNNKRLLLKGVCRHEFTHAAGYSPSAEEVRRELARIKHAGFNYVRLVHSPQSPIVCRLAAKLGLLVSEEPGTCWHDLGNEEVVAPAVECLRRTVLRDRNVPSILAWFIYNECAPNIDYAVRITRRVRELDPGCLVSTADFSSDAVLLKEVFTRAGMDFYGLNVYDQRKGFLERMAALNDRPIVITEWSGFLGQGNARQMKDFCELFVRHTREDTPLRVSGGSIWVWADYEEHSRPGPATIDGWTVEGLVDPHGHPKADLLLLSQMAYEMDYPPRRLAPPLEILAPAPRRCEPWQPLALEEALVGQQALQARMDAARTYQQYEPGMLIPEVNGYAEIPPLPYFGRLLLDGIEFRCHDAAGSAYPLLLGKERPTVVIPVGRRVTGVAVLGQVALQALYPSAVLGLPWKKEIGRALSAPAAEYEFVFADGSVVQPLRHGLEILRCNDVLQWWTPAPRAPYTRPAVRAITDTRNEFFRLDLWQRDFPVAELVEIRWKLHDDEALLLIAGISVRVGE